MQDIGGSRPSRQASLRCGLFISYTYLSMDSSSPILARPKSAILICAGLSGVSLVKSMFYRISVVRRVRPGETYLRLEVTMCDALRMLIVSYVAAFGSSSWTYCVSHGPANLQRQCGSEFLRCTISTSIPRLQYDLRKPPEFGLLYFMM